MLIGLSPMQKEQLSADEKKEDPNQWMKKLGLLSIVVGDLLGFSAVGIGLGYWAWTRWHAPWWVLVITSGIGLGIAFYRLYLLSQKI